MGASPARGPDSLANALRRALFSKRARWLWGCALAVLTLIVLALALSPTGVAVPGNDKSHHVSAFAVLGFVALFALRERVRAPFWVGFFLLALGVGIELIQYHVPGRSADPADVVADAIGIALGLGCASWLAQRLDRRRQPRRDSDPSTPTPSALTLPQP